jgi:hypothetical protein
MRSFDLTRFSVRRSGSTGSPICWIRWRTRHGRVYPPYTSNAPMRTTIGFRSPSRALRKDLNVEVKESVLSVQGKREGKRTRAR